MTVRRMQDEIIRLKKEKDICILAHSYQAREIIEVADYVGDSFQLSVKAQTAPQDTVIMCGVRFMAETVKILSPHKRVILSHPDAGCPMAEQMDVDLIRQLQANNPGAATVAYINTTAQLKTVCDVCVTSSSAVKIVRNMAADKIIFIPDCNLGAYVQEQVPDKKLILVHGGCPTHAKMTEEDVLAAKKAHPDALFLVHPECTREVTKHADYIGSTSGIMDYAKKSEAREFIIGTENSIAEHLQYECPDKKFYVLGRDLVCHNMKLTTLPDVYGCVVGTAGCDIELDGDTIAAAGRCIDEMLRLG
ncbi:MAG: quinolinate synthase NadA [Clostridia bacterium]|nr:quinolinate synthase NadA [Clostridia bacterium]